MFLRGRKLMAKGFLFGMTLWYFLPTGNCLRKVSRPAWRCGTTYRQETICERFPIRLDALVFLTVQETIFEGIPIGRRTVGIHSDQPPFPSLLKLIK